MVLPSEKPSLGRFDAMLCENPSKSRFQAAACTIAVWVMTPSRLVEVVGADVEWPEQLSVGPAPPFHHVDGRMRYDGVDTVLRSRGIGLAYGSPDDSVDEASLPSTSRAKRLAVVSASQKL